MADTIKYISKVEIKGLWGKFNFEWNLLPDVNVLSGINGSGKSTILNCVSKLITSNGMLNGNHGDQIRISELGKLVGSCKILFESGDYALYEFINRIDRIETKIKDKAFGDIKIDNYHKSVYSGPNYWVYMTESISLWDINNLFNIDAISTFDDEFKPAEAINKVSDVNVKTELDWQIYHLNNRYIEYKLNIANKINEAISKNVTNGGLIKIQTNQNRFLDILDTLFLQTGKKINRKENKISFLIGGEKITPYQLSSGEKQLLIILLTVLVQDNKNAILFMDEPEISLHFDWQKDLIAYIRELNPNVQVILATHSPAIIMDGWMDKVADVSDLIKPA